MAWNAAAHARATLSVSLTFSTDWTIVGVEIRNLGLVAPEETRALQALQKSFGLELQG